jgi:transposase-like protein
VAARLKAMERENRELRQANDILRKASAYFALAPLGERRRSPAGQGDLDRRHEP